MNILSLFDGISCGKLALDRANIQVDKYYASEINKYAISISKKHFPSIIQLGDIKKWHSWNLPKIDLLIGGSPCQGFSFAGKKLNFDDCRSKLFFEFVDILNFYSPKYFLLENVRMRSEWEKIISSYLGIQPIIINSSLVSAQNRERLYWTNFNFDQPKDKNINLSDIIIKDMGQNFKILSRYGKIKNTNKSGCLTSSTTNHSGGNHSDMDIVCFGNPDDILYSKKHRILLKTNVGNIFWRRYSPLECERLQTLPDNYTAGLSNTQRYNCISNGWTIDIVAHIFSFLPKKHVIE